MRAPKRARTVAEPRLVDVEFIRVEEPKTEPRLVDVEITRVEEGDDDD